MAWLQANWVWLAIIVVFFWVMRGGHGARGGGGGCCAGGVHRHEGEADGQAGTGEHEHAGH